MKFTVVENILWSAGLLGHVALLSVLLVKKRFRVFPVFGAYIVFAIAETITLFIVSREGSHTAYFDTYWTFACCDYVFQLGLIFEIARHVLRPGGTWLRDVGRRSLLWSAIGAVAAAGLALSISPPHQTGIALWTQRSLIFSALLTCEVFLAMATAANNLGLQWRSHVMALGQGLTAWATIALANDIASLAPAWRGNSRPFSTICSAAYLATLVFWIISFALPEHQREPLSGEMEEDLLALHKSMQYDLSVLQSMDKRSSL